MSASLPTIIMLVLLLIAFQCDSLAAKYAAYVCIIYSYHVAGAGCYYLLTFY